MRLNRTLVVVALLGLPFLWNAGLSCPPPVAPAVNKSAGTTSFTEDAGAVTVDSSMAVTDTDNLKSATVTITNIQDGSAEVLACGTLGGLSPSYSSGVLTLTGVASVSTYQTALRSVTYNNSSHTPNTTTRVLRFQVTDITNLNSSTGTHSDKSVSVTAVVDPPTVTPSGGTTSFTEDGGAVTVDGSVVVDDLDSTNLTSATVTITNLQDGSSEALACGTPGSLTVTYTAGTGVLKLTGSATLATYQTALRSVTYNNTSQNPNTTTRVVRFKARDSTADGSTSDKNVSVTAVNDAPTVTASGGTTTFTEDGGAVTVDGSVVVADVDNINLTSATVTITNLQDGSSEALACGTPGSLTVTYTAGTGVLKLTGSASVATYQTALRSVTYNNTSQNPNTTTRVIRFKVKDSTTDSSTSDKNVSVSASIDPPVVTASGGTTSFTEDGGAVTVDGSVAVTDVDSTNLTSATVTITNLQDGSSEALACGTPGGLTVIYTAGTGVLKLTGSAMVATYQTALRSVTYNNTSQNPNTTTRVIRFKVKDSTTDSNASDKNVSVTAGDDPPTVTASGGTTSFTEDGGAVTVDGSVAVTDVDSTNLTSATVTITNLQDGSSEALACGTPGGLTVIYTAGTGVLKLTGLCGASC